MTTVGMRMHMPIDPIRILLVDDSAEFLETAARFLAEHPYLQVVGYALSGREALVQVPVLNPDLILVDLMMPGMNGLETTRQLKAYGRTYRIVVMSLYDVVEYREAAHSVAADGFIAKSAIHAGLLSLIDTLFAKAVADSDLSNLYLSSEHCNTYGPSGDDFNS